MGTKRRAEDYVKFPGRASYPTSERDRSPDRVTFPVPPRHSTATLHSQVAGEGHNNKEFAP
jgi:hypothetical protein